MGRSANCYIYAFNKSIKFVNFIILIMKLIKI